jgi:LPS sulfotransferase NodH
LGTDANHEYLKRLIESTTTPNGVFSIKVHAHHLGKMRAHVHMRTRPWRRRRSNPFVYLADSQSYVHLNRRDKLQQAVSLYRAELTLEWSRTGNKPTPPDPTTIDVDALDDCLRRVDEADARWHRFFERNDITPLELTYEDDLDVEHGAAALKVLDAAGIDRPSDLVAASGYQRQRDAWSEAVEQIYLHAKSRTS